MRKILMTKELRPENLLMLRSRFPQCEFIMPGENEPLDDRLIRQAEVIFGGIDSRILLTAERLRWFHSVSAGVDTYIDDFDRLGSDGPVTTNSAGVYGIPISEHLLALMLALAHRLGPSVLNMPVGKWGGIVPCSELHGSTVGIVGYGDIGSHLAGLLIPFECEVLAFKRTEAEKPPTVSAMLYGSGGLDELMQRSDFICVCLPGTPVTRGLIDRRRIGLMKPTASIYNIGRGYIIDTDALTEALAAGRIAGAGLDVTDPEPLPPGHPLWSLPNVIITPHISGNTPPQWEYRQAEFFARNLEAYLEGKALPGAVDMVNKY